MNPALWLTDGRRSLIDEVDALLRECGEPADVDIIIGAAGVKDARQVAAWRAAGRIGRLRVVLNSGLLALRRGAADGQRHNARDLEEAFTADAVRLIDLHGKAVIVRGRASTAAVITSANLNHNNRPEQYELADHLADGLARVVDRVFEVVPPGCADYRGPAAYRGLQEALRTIGGRGIVVHPGAEDVAPGEIAEDDQLLVLCRAGVGEILPALAARLGTPLSVSAASWGIGHTVSFRIARWLESGVLADFRLAVPARFGRRQESAYDYACAAAALGERIRWSPTHAKVLVARGPRGCAVVSGSANLTPIGKLDFARVRMGDDALADLATQLVDHQRGEDAPSAPEDVYAERAAVAYARFRVPELSGGEKEEQEDHARSRPPRSSRAEYEERIRVAEELLRRGKSDRDAARALSAKFEVTFARGQKWLSEVRRRWKLAASERHDRTEGEVREETRERYAMILEKSIADKDWRNAGRMARMIAEIDGLLADRKRAGADARSPDAELAALIHGAMEDRGPDAG